MFGGGPDGRLERGVSRVGGGIEGGGGSGICSVGGDVDRENALKEGERSMLATGYSKRMGEGIVGSLPL